METDVRVVNRVASMLLAAALLAAGLFTVAEAVIAALGRPALLTAGWYPALTGTRLDDPTVRAVAVLLIVAGLLILFAQLRRWTPERIRLPGAPGWHLHRRSTERRLADVARAVPGVRRTRVRLRRKRKGWRSRVRAVGDPALRPAVERAVRLELARLTAPTGDPEFTFVADRDAR